MQQFLWWRHRSWNLSISQKYKNLDISITKHSEHILDLYSVWLSNADPFVKIMQSFISIQNTKGIE